MNSQFQVITNLYDQLQCRRSVKATIDFGKSVKAEYLNN